MPDICNALLTIIGVLVTYIGAVYIEWIVFPRRLTGEIDLRTILADWRFVGLTTVTLYIIGVAPFCSTNLIAGTVLVALLLTYLCAGCRGGRDRSVGRRPINHMMLYDCRRPGVGG